MDKSLNILLSELNILYVKLRNYHWNVIGQDFMQLHKFFGGLYEMVSGDIDTIAERIRGLQATPFASLREYIDNSSIKETFSETSPSSDIMLKNLLVDFVFIVDLLKKQIKEATDDPGTENMLLNMLEQYEKQTWMIRSFTQ